MSARKPSSADSTPLQAHPPKRGRRSEKTAVWRLFGAIVIPFLLLVGRYRWQNAERIPKTGAFILAANHVTNFDPLVTAYTLWHHGRVPRYLAKAGLFRLPIVGWAFRVTGQVPVARAVRGQSSTLEAAGRITDEGLALVIYPEGTLTRDPELWPMRGKSGAVRIALEHDVPIIPAAHWGDQKIMGRYSSKISLFPRKPVDILIGEPMDLSPWKGKPLTGEVLSSATAALMAEITRLVEQLRGEKAPAERWDPSEHGQSEFGTMES
ncbi:lysophospholipid acyltransferase family protein [Lysinimonas soli]|uniref:Lysophospholipid acyltransferase family protein n=1 Tax=Lysinimonas soli TaxID=1074233 RepID=A0ABW0NRM6_9MICO